MMASDAVLQRGVGFLVAEQSGGRWGEFRTLAGEGSDWPTAYIAGELSAAWRAARGGAPAASEGDGGVERALAAAAGALVAGQHVDGGWGFHRGVPSDADSTACAVRFLAGRPGVGRDVLDHGAACLALHQDARSGGVATYGEPGPIRAFMELPAEVDLRGWCARHAEVTAMAGRAFVAAGEGWWSAAEAAWRFLAGRQKRDGSWRSYWWSSPEVATSHAVALARELDACAGADRARAEAVAAAEAWTLERQLDCGGFAGGEGAVVSSFVTALSLSLLAGAPRCAGEAARAAARLRGLQLGDGSWPAGARMRIPPPGLAEPDGAAFAEGALGTGVGLRDRHRRFTTAACVAALARSGAGAA